MNSSPLHSSKKRSAFRKKVFKMVSVGVVDDFVNQLYDIISTAALLINLTITIMNTFESLHLRYGWFFDDIEFATVAFFAVDYFLRIYTAKCLFPRNTELSAIIRYAVSFSGLIDLLSFAPYFLPMFFPAGAAVFKMFRVARILRLFRINAYYDSLNVITEVLSRKKQQLLSSVFIIVVLMLASSLCMYSIENAAQPDVFTNAFSGIWWAASTLLTVGYGDIYPITPFGKAVGIFITFLGVGMVAIPTGIISAGFVEQYSRLQSIGHDTEADIHFIKIELLPEDKWAGKQISKLDLPKGILISLVQRGEETIIPRGNVRLKAGDRLILGADALKGDRPVYLKEILLKDSHRWIGTAIRDLDISRQTFIVLVKRGNTSLLPKGDLVLEQNDTVILYSRTKTRISSIETNEEI